MLYCKWPEVDRVGLLKARTHYTSKVVHGVDAEVAA